MDLRGVPTAKCICGSDWFRIAVRFDENYEICMYTLDGECMNCGIPVTVCTPIDLPEDSK